MIKIANRLQNILTSATTEMMIKAANLKAQGVDVIDLSIGEPSFQTPEIITEYAVAAMKEGYTKYTNFDGLPELKDAVIAKFKRDNGLSYSREEVIITAGAKQAVFNAFMATLEEGDEAIIPVPYWVAYPEIVKLTGATPVFVPLDPNAGYSRTVKAIESYVTDKTVAIVLNSPSNPTGALLEDNFINGLIEVCNENNILIVSDETYEQIVFDKKYKSIAAYENAMNNTLTVNSMSKTYAMTGWRLGYAAGPEELIKKMVQVQAQSTSCPNSIAQKASIDTISGDQSIVTEMREEYRRRRDFVYSELSGIPDTSLHKPDGALFAFPDVSRYYGFDHNGKTIENSVDFAEFLMDEFKVVVVPGAAFGRDENIRISYAASMDIIEEGIRRLKEALKHIRE